MLKFPVDIGSFIESCCVRIKEKRRFSCAEVNITGDISFELLLSKLPKDINVEGKAVCGVIHNCARCLEEFVCEMEVPIGVTKPFDWGFEKEVDITEDFTAGALLSVPISPLCKEKCLGLCQVCGKNRNKEKCACAPDGQAFSALGDLKKIKFK